MQINRPQLFALLIALSVSVVPEMTACGVKGTPPTNTLDTAGEQSAQVPLLPKGHVWRYRLMEVMSPGLGAFLQRVDVKEHMVGGEFHGFRLLARKGDPAFWEDVDIQVGDVITQVNASPIGHHDEAYRVWQSLITADEIVIDYERDGRRLQSRIVVHEDDDMTAVLQDSQ